MTVIAHPHTDSARGRQLTAAIALTKMLEQPLPAAEWRICNIHPGTLEGQIGEGADEETLARLQEWATFLGAEVRQDGPDTVRSGYTFTTVEVRATYREVEVRVWAHIKQSGLDKQTSGVA